MSRPVLVGSSEFDLVDLSVEVDENYPCWWVGAIPFRANTFMNYEPWAFPAFERSLTMDEHTGTHFDSPRHFLADSSSFSEHVPLETFMGPARVIDVTSAPGTPGRSPLIGIDALAAHEAEAGLIPPGSVALLRTLWSEEHYGPWPHGASYLAEVLSGRAPGWPAPDGDLIDKLADRGVGAIGIDAPSLGATHEPVTAHVAALRRGLIPIENLTNLSRLPIHGATFLFLPLRVLGGSGSPGRAVALLPRQSDA